MQRVQEQESGGRGPSEQAEHRSHARERSQGNRDGGFGTEKRKLLRDRG